MSAARQASEWIERHSRGESMDGFADWINQTPENMREFLAMSRIVHLSEASPVLQDFDVEAAIAEAIVEQ